LRQRFNPRTGKIEYVEDLLLEAPEQGPQGDQGLPGAPGSQGAPGLQGPEGRAGSQIIILNAAPDHSLGGENDLGFQPISGAFYRKVDGRWKYLVNLTGQRGREGSRGADGAQGQIGPTGPSGLAGQTGATGPSGVISATYPLSYDSITQTVAVSGSVAKRTISTVITVPADYTQFFRAPVLASGGEIRCDSDGEAHII
jgi:hypothetical protein